MLTSERVSEAEYEVLKMLWSANTALSSADICARLKDSMGWEKSTVRTLIQRLTDKGAIVKEQREMFYYTPCMSEKSFMAEQTQHFLKKYHSGSVKKLVASLFEMGCVKSEDLQELRTFWNKGDTADDE